MSFFSKKEMDTNAAKEFWNWFSEKEEWIKSNINTNGTDVIWAIDEQIKPVFPYFKKELEFQLGSNGIKGEFFFFHFGDKNLIKDSAAFAEMMPQSLSDRWKFIAEN